MALDWGILYWIQDHLTCPFLDAVMPKLTLLGDAGIIWILAAAALLCTKKYRRQGAVLLLGLLCGLLVGNVCLKHLVARARPCWLDESVHLLIASPTDYSFPSGHTLSSTISATILTKADRRFGYAAILLSRAAPQAPPSHHLTAQAPPASLRAAPAETAAAPAV